MTYTGYKDEYENIIIPLVPNSMANWRNSPVTRIGDGAFEYSEKLISIIIPEGITYIGFNAFNSCPNLTTVTIPKSVTHIDNWAFNKCDKLETIYVKENSYAHEWCLKNDLGDKIQFN